MSDSIWEDPKLTAYILGELPEDERAVFEEMIQTNPKLADAVNEARDVTDQLQVMYAAEANTTLDQNRRETITHQQSTSVLTPKSTYSWRVPVTVLATAAALLPLIGVPLLYKELPSSLGEAIQSRSLFPESEPTDSPLMTMADEAESLMLEESVASGEYEKESVDVPPLDGAANDSRIQPPQPHPNEAQRLNKMRSLGGGGMGGRIAEEKSTELQTSSQPGDSQAELRNGHKADVQSRVTTKPEPFPTEKSAAFGAAPSPVGKAQSKVHRQRSVGELNKSMDQDLSINTPASPSQPDAVAGFDVSRIIGNATKRKMADSSDDLIEQALSILDKGDSAPRDRFSAVTENAFKRVVDAPLSTFSVDVDTASYSKVREYLLSQHRRPPVDAIRIEEMINYFNYEYLPPDDAAEYPFAAKAEIMSCPWNDNHRLARIALKGKAMQPEDRPLSNLVFLLDTSGSMNSSKKLPLVKEGMKMLLSQLGENDRVAITVYAGSAGLVLDSTSATKTAEIDKALSELAAGGSTNGSAGINLAYDIARDNFIPGGVNRVILCTDGDFNVGTTGTGSLVRMVEQQAAGGIFLSVLAFGMGNHNDEMLEKISGRGNGNYAFIDSKREAQKVLVDQTNATLVTIAKDVKLQIEFNPRLVAAYRLIGYENRVLAKEDFNDDKKDAGEIGAGHAVTALYELIPAEAQDTSLPPKVDALKYQGNPQLSEAANGGETLTLKLRYKEPDGDTSKLFEFPVVDNETAFKDADHDARFATAVASFGMQLRGSKHAGQWKLNDVLTVAEDAKGEDESGLRSQFVEMIQAAKKIMGQ